MPLSGEQAYIRPETFLLELNAEELGFVDNCIEQSLCESWEDQNITINKKLRAIKNKIERLKDMKRKLNLVTSEAEQSKLIDKAFLTHKEQNANIKP